MPDETMQLRAVKPDITVRRLRASDREGWQRLWQEYLRFYRADVSASTSEVTFSRLCEADSNADPASRGRLDPTDAGRSKSGPRGHRSHRRPTFAADRSGAVS